MVVPPHLSRANTRVFVCPKFSRLSKHALLENPLTLIAVLTEGRVSMDTGLVAKAAPISCCGTIS